MIEAQIYLATGRSAEALPLILSALAAFPDEPWYNATAGDYYHYHQNDPAQAVSYYRKAAEFAPQQAILQAALGTALYDTGQTAEAIPIMEQAITLAPTDPNIYLRIGSVLIKYADWEQLIQFYETAVANNIDHPDINTQLANAHAARDQ
jgi:tetratricopeptide (TPR) repeat protein